MSDEKKAPAGLPAGGTDVKTERPFRIQDHIEVCTIHDSFSHTGAYVLKTLSGSTKSGMRLSEVCATPFGTRSVTQLVIGDAVQCLSVPGINWSIILGVIPSQITDGRFILADSLVMCGQVGLFQDPVHRVVYENDDNRMPNFSCGRPVDTLQGDWGMINDFGVAFWIGRIMAQMRASDVAKIEAFWGDDLIRLFAYNFQKYTAARELFAFDDEGEYDEIERWTPYMWESLGSYKAGEEVFDEYRGDEGGLQKDRKKSRFEPKEEGKQSMAFRGQTMRGFLGDGERESIVLLPNGAEGISKVDDEENYRGVFEAHKMLDGTFAVRSSKQILFEKSLIIPVPRQLLDPDDPSGDTSVGDDANYKAAGEYGDGPTQEKKPFKWAEDEYPNDRALSLWEQQAYLLGKYGLQVIDAHEKDWKAPEEQELEIDDEKQNEIDSTLFDAALEFQFVTKLPKYGEVTIDQRDGYDVRYYQTRSCIQMLDDGSIVIEDGYGSQLLMSGGNIHLSCMGDVFNRPGRNFITWAPRDIISRAGWCNEITASKKDVRIKAENSLQMRAGTEDKGSILIECVAESKPAKSDWSGKLGEDVESNGIIIKAEKSAIDVWAKYVFAGTTKDEEGTVELNSGTGRTTVAGDIVGVEALAQFGVLVGASRSKTSTPAQFGMDTSSAFMRVSRFDMVGNLGVWTGATGGGKIEADRDILTNASMGAVQNIFCAGIMAANGMSSSNKHNGTGGGTAPTVSSQGGKVESEASSQKQQLFAPFDDFTLDDTEIGPGNQDVWDAVGFSFRTSEDQYKIDDSFQVQEARWQQLYRAFGVSETWEEPIVKAPTGEDTRPHPGNQAWEQDDHLKYLDPGDSKNVDYTKGRSKNRDDQSEEAPSLKDGKLKDEFLINVQLS